MEFTFLELRIANTAAQAVYTLSDAVRDKLPQDIYTKLRDAERALNEVHQYMHDNAEEFKV